MYFIKQAVFQVLLNDICAACDCNTFVIRGSFCLFEGAFDAIGDEDECGSLP